MNIPIGELFVELWHRELIEARARESREDREAYKAELDAVRTAKSRRQAERLLVQGDDFAVEMDDKQYAWFDEEVLEKCEYKRTGLFTQYAVRPRRSCPTLLLDGTPPQLG